MLYISYQSEIFGDLSIFSIDSFLFHNVLFGFQQYLEDSV